MAKKSRTKSQKKYKMVGCNKSKNSKKNRSKNSKKPSKKYLGGTATLMPANYQAGNPFSNDAKAYPAKGPQPGGFNFLNPQTSPYKGVGGGCGGKNPLPAANGLLGKAWNPSIGSWPGVDGNPNNGNHLGYNTYDNDVSRQMKDVGAAYPYTYMKGGKRRSNTKNTLRNIKRMSKKNRRSRKNKNKHSKKKGGGINNYLLQDFVNLGRNVKYNMSSKWNALNGYSAPVNPNPWEDQYEHSQLKNNDKTFY
jgi:hypothetical protein